MRILEGLRGFVMRWKSMLLAVTTSAALTAASFPAIADDVVIGGGDPDTVAPVFQNVTISQDHVDVSDGPVTLTVTTRITDDKSGFSHGSIGIHEPAGGSGSDYSAYLYSGYRTTGDANDGTYTSTIQVDQYAKPGTYQIYCQAWDLKSNRTTTCPDDTVVVQPDFTPPTIEECVAETGTASTSAGETTVPVRVEASDDASGVQTVTATIRDDASGSSYSGDLSMTGGTKNDGTWKGTVTVPGDAPAGDYDLSCDAEDEVVRGTGPTPGTGGDGSGGAVVVTPEPPIGGGTGDGGTGGGGAGGGGGTGAETGDADLVLTKTVDRAEALQGDTLTWTITVRNEGTATATNTTVTDQLPTGVTFFDAAESCTETNGAVTCAAGDLEPGGEASVEVRATVDAMPLLYDPNSAHQLDGQKQEAPLSIEPGQATSGSVTCPAGTLAAEGGVRLDAVDQGGSFGDLRVVSSSAAGDAAGWSATVANTGEHRAQGKVWVSCLNRATYGGRGHEHQVQTADPVSESRTVDVGRTTVQLPACSSGGVPIAPSYVVAGGDARVVSSTRSGDEWWFTLEATTRSTVELSHGCLSSWTTAAADHRHRLNTVVVADRGSVAPGETREVTLDCGARALVAEFGDLVGLTSSVAVGPGLVHRGTDPQAKVRRFGFTNLAADARDFDIALTCLAVRTSGEPRSTTLVNEASAATTSPETDLADNVDAANTLAHGEGWAGTLGGRARIAPHGRRIILPVSAGSDMSVRAELVAERGSRRRVRRGDRIAVGRASLTAGTGNRVSIKVPRALRRPVARGRVRSATLILTTSDGNTLSQRVRLR